MTNPRIPRDTGFTTYLPSEQYIGLYIELTDKVMLEKYGDLSKFQVVKRNNFMTESVSYNEKGQDIFNEISDEITEILGECGIFNESDR
mgnify:CR=1 FL=1|tara:strand:+ start:256 stop:522 length:267 start_codon:yes stop_codon:yes gene_type:complete